MSKWIGLLSVFVFVYVLTGLRTGVFSTETFVRTAKGNLKEVGDPGVNAKRRTSQKKWEHSFIFAVGGGFLGGVVGDFLGSFSHDPMWIGAATASLIGAALGTISFDQK